MVLQSSKQKRLNDIDVLVTLGLEQVQAFSDGGAAVPQDLSSVLVFSRSELARLGRRIEVGHLPFIPCRSSVKERSTMLWGICHAWLQCKGQKCQLNLLESDGNHSAW